MAAWSYPTRPALRPCLAGFEGEAFQSMEALAARGLPERDACLVLDIDLPGIDGIELRGRLGDSGGDLPTIFITAVDRAEVNEPLAALKPEAVLYKPFNKKDLLEAIGQACRRPEAGRRAAKRPA